MRTQIILSALALTFALGVAAPAFADNSVRFPGIAVEKETERLADQKLESKVEPVTIDAPEFG